MSKEEIIELLEPSTQVISEESLEPAPLRSFGRSQTFSRFADEYSYNEVKDCVEVVGQIDLVKKINSAYDSNLSKLLDMYLNGEADCDVCYLPDSDKKVAIVGGFKSKIDKYQDLCEEAVKIKEALKLDESLSIDETFKAALRIKEANENKINDISAKAEVVRNLKNKEVKKDEKEAQPESKS